MKSKKDSLLVGGFISTAGYSLTKINRAFLYDPLFPAYTR